MLCMVRFNGSNTYSMVRKLGSAEPLTTNSPSYFIARSHEAAELLTTKSHLYSRLALIVVSAMSNCHFKTKQQRRKALLLHTWSPCTWSHWKLSRYEREPLGPSWTEGREPQGLTDSVDPGSYFKTDEDRGRTPGTVDCAQLRWDVNNIFTCDDIKLWVG